MSFKTCEDCGSRMYSRGCTYCNEELYILDQYLEQGMELPKEDSTFIKKVNKQLRDGNKTNY